MKQKLRECVPQPRQAYMTQNGPQTPSRKRGHAQNSWERDFCRKKLRECSSAAASLYGPKTDPKHPLGTGGMFKIPGHFIFAEQKSPCGNVAQLRQAYMDQTKNTYYKIWG